MTEEQLKEERVKQRWRLIYPLVIVFVCMFAAVGVSITYTHNAVRNDEQNWCEVVVSLDNEYQVHPPPADNAAAVTFAANMHRLRQKLHCS